mgnify:FL=1
MGRAAACPITTMFTVTRKESPTSGPKTSVQFGFRHPEVASFNAQVNFEFSTKAAEEGFFACYSPAEAAFACCIGLMEELMHCKEFHQEPGFFVGSRRWPFCSGEDHDNAVKPYHWLATRHTDLLYSSPRSRNAPNPPSTPRKPFQGALMAAMWDGEPLVRISIAPSVEFHNIRKIHGALHVREDLVDLRKVLTLSSGVEAFNPSDPGSLSYSTLEQIMKALLTVEDKVAEEAEKMPFSAVLMARGTSIPPDGDEPASSPVKKPQKIETAEEHPSAGFYMFVPSSWMSRLVDKVFGWAYPPPPAK